MLPSVFFLCVGEGAARGVEPGVAVTGVAIGVIGPGVSGAVGALTLGAVKDDTARMAMIKRAVRTTTVMAARRIPRRGFGVGLLLKWAHSSGEVERASLSKTPSS